MKKLCRIINRETLEKICDNSDTEYIGVVLGHENCPVFYRQLDIDSMVDVSIKNNLKVWVNIPVLFEDYFDEFKNETQRLIEKYPLLKFIVNDWGILACLHRLYPNRKFTAGKGISFTYGDNPWNEHILFAEKEKYQEDLKAHNMENLDTIEQLKLLGIDEIELSDLEMSHNAYKNLSSNGFSIIVNKGMSIATMSRACHCLRFLNKVDEMGNCIKYCTKNIKISVKKYYNMMENELMPISADTKSIQPDMYINGNIAIVKNDKPAYNYDNVEYIVYDERIMKVCERS